MKFTLFAALATLVASTSALVAPAPRNVFESVVTGHVDNGLIGESSSEVRRSRVAPGDSNAERMARGLAPKAPAGIYQRSPSRTAGAKRQQPSPTAGNSHANLLAYDTAGNFVGAFWRADDGAHVVLSKTAGFNFDTSTMDAATEQSISFGSTDSSGTTTTFYLASYVKATTSASGSNYIQFGYANVNDGGNPVNFCYTQARGFETSNFGWGQGLFNTYGSYQFYIPGGITNANIYLGNDGFLYAAEHATDITNQSPLLTESAKLTLYWIQA